jgi:hypothetical protein
MPYYYNMYDTCDAEVNVTFKDDEHVQSSE